jgi:hypothetical protein
VSGTIENVLVDLFERSGTYGPSPGEVWDALGIDPDMPIETLRQRLLWGGRVEQMKPQNPGGTRGEDREQILTRNDIIRWLTRPDNPPSPTADVS